MEIQETLQEVCRRFRIPGTITEYRHLTTGNINTSYYVKCTLDENTFKEYLVQKVNCYVFKDPVSVMHNIDLVTEHIRKQKEKDGKCQRRERLHFHHTEDGKNYVFLESSEGREFWRLSNFIENSYSFDLSDDLNVLKMSGKAFGQFEAQLQSFDATLLTETIPHFHDTRMRLDNFFKDVDEDICGRCKEAKEEIEYIRSNYSIGCRLNEMIDHKEIPFRVTHNDTKTNNVLFDNETGEPLVVIDLDTVMPGLAAFDFGDTIRFAASTALEDEPDTSRVSLSMDKFRAFTEGYITETAGFLSEKELDSMALGAVTITLELASRFLDDYITGDKYFKINYPEHNLVRTRAQLTLLKDMLAKYEEMDLCVHEIAARCKS